MSPEDTPPGAPPRDALYNLCLADPVWTERYEGWTELGHGGSASVVRTRSRALGEDLALKIFPRLSAEDWDRFREEVRNAQRLTSPYIVRTYSPFPRGSLAWIELEWVDGPNLRQELERRATVGEALSVDEVLSMGRAVAAALATAHEAGVLHRDVKPANILLPRSGRPVAKLGDFGISRLAGAARLTRTGLMVGTPQFAAPEVIAGDRGGAEADVYSFALCLYLALSNDRPPFEIQDETSPTQWMRAHTDQRPRSIGAHNPAAPVALVRAIDAALAKEPRRRPPLPEMLDILTALRSGASGPTRILARPPIPRRWVASTALLGAGVLGLWGAHRLTRAGASPPPVAAAPSSARPAEASAGPSAQASLAEEATDRGLPSIPKPALPEPAPPPSTPPTTPPPPFEVALRGDLLSLVHTGSLALPGVQVTLVAPGGRRFTTRIVGGLGPGEAAHLALEAFDPPAPPGMPIERVEIRSPELGPLSLPLLRKGSAAH